MNTQGTTSLSVIHSMFQNAPVGVLIVAKDDSGIIYANQSTEQILGYTEGGLEGKSLDALLPAFVKDRHNALMAGYFAAPKQRMMGSGGELHATHRNGHLVPVEIALAPILVDGKSCAMAYITDISSRIQQRQQYENIIVSMPQGILLVDTSGTIVMTNPALDQQFGYIGGELKGKTLETLLPHRFRSGHANYLKSYAAHPTQRTMGVGRDLTALHKSGVEFPVEIALNSLKLGSELHLIAVVSDISIRKYAEDALRQTNAQLEEFTYVASHDLRSPLRGIADLVSWIKEDFPSDAMTPSVANNFDRIEVRIQRCDRMIEDLLEYARAGNHNESRIQTNLTQLVSEVLGELALPDSFKVVSHIEVNPFSTSPTPLKLCLRNLIGNAVKHHGSASGNIVVTAHEEGRFARITVEDDGKGIPAGADKLIFKLFHRASATTEGHGVGLAVTRRMIHAQGGSITVGKSPHLGGACFTVLWPCIELKGIDYE